MTQQLLYSFIPDGRIMVTAPHNTQAAILAAIDNAARGQVARAENVDSRLSTQTNDVFYLEIDGAQKPSDALIVAAARTLKMSAVCTNT